MKRLLATLSRLFSSTSRAQKTSEILYTNGSTTKATKPNMYGALGGARILSNKYDPARSCWVMAFDRIVTEIGEGAFDDCTSLTSITIPDGVTEIGKYAFCNCTSLTSITIPDGVTEIGKYAFCNCTSLTSITIPDGVTEIGKGAFDGCTSLTSITIPDSVTSIGERAFCHCGSLTSVTIPDGVTEIGEGAFCHCGSLTSVTIPDGVTEIGEGAFYDCTSLTSVYCKSTTPPKGSPNMFYYNAQGLKIYVPQQSVEAYKKADGWKRFADSIVSHKNSNEQGGVPSEILYTNGSTTEAITPRSSYVFRGAKVISNSYDPARSCWVMAFDRIVTEIGGGAFYGCTSLTSITIPDSVTKIREWEFHDCKSLTSITIPDSVTEIGYSAFSDCASLTSVTIPNSVTSIGISAFSGCSSLTNITIPNSVTEIGRMAFMKCTSLTSITIPDSVTSIGDDAFWNCSSLTNITIPNSVTSIGISAFSGCSNLAEINGKFASPDKRCLIVEGRLVSFAPVGLTQYTIPNGVTEIGGAFCGCSNLAEFNGKFASPDKRCLIVEGRLVSFARAGLTQYTIPDGVTEIGARAFLFCTSLTSITIPDSVTEIGEDAFYNCTSLTSVYCKSTTPPKGSPNMFDYNAFYYNAQDRKIYVPRQSVEAYKNAEYWGNYTDSIVGYDF